MSLNTKKAQAKADIKALLEEMLTKEENSTEEFADRLVEIMFAWLQQATIKYNSGLVAPSGGGTITGTFNGNLE